MRNIYLRKSKGPVITTVAMLFIDDENPDECVVVRLTEGRAIEVAKAVPGNDIAGHAARIFANFPICSLVDFRAFIKAQKVKQDAFHIEGWLHLEIGKEALDGQA
jgi:hypothetical protein